MKIFKKIKTFFNTWKEQRENRKEQRRNKKHSRKLIKIERKQLKLSNKAGRLDGGFKLKDKKKDSGYFDGWLQKRLGKNGGYLQDWYTRNKDFKASGFISDKKINKKTIDKMEHDWNMKYNDFYRRGYEWAKRQSQLAKNDREKWARWENQNKKKWGRKLQKDIDFLDRALDGGVKEKEKKLPKSRAQRREEKREYNRRYNSEYYEKNKDKHRIHYAHKKYKDNQKEEIEYLKRTIENQLQEIKRLTKNIDDQEERIKKNQERENEYRQKQLLFEKQIDDLNKLIESLRDHVNKETKEEEDYLPPKELPSNNGWEDNEDSDDITDEQIETLLDDLYQEFKEDEIMSRILGDDDNFGRLFDIEGDSISSIINDIIQDSPLYEHYSSEELEGMLINKYSKNSI